MFNTDRIDHLYQDPHVTNQRFFLHYGDLTDSMNLTRIIQEVQPDEIYNLAAMSHVKVSFDNHESPVRGETFVTRKITRAVARIALGLQDVVYLGNLSAKRDWGHAKDYVRAMYMVLQQDRPDDYVIATGITTEIREFVRKTFGSLGIEIEFKGEGVNEKAFVVSCENSEYTLKKGKKVLEVDPAYFRPTEVDILIGNADKAKKQLGWEPEYDLDGLIEEMINSDIELMKKESLMKKNGYNTFNYFE